MNIRGRILKLKLKIKKPKVILISHSDADGIACAAISLNYVTQTLKYNGKEIEILFSGPTAIPYTLKAIEHKGDLIVITDISPNIRELKNIYNELRRLKKLNWKIFWIDHHKWSSKALSKISQLVDNLIVEEAPSAAQLAFKILTPNMNKLVKIVEYANDIDTLTDKFKESFTIRTLTFNKKWKWKLLKKFSSGKPVDHEIINMKEKIERIAEKEVKNFKKSF